MSIFKAILGHIQQIFDEAVKDAESFINEITPGIKAAARQAIKVFGTEAVPVLEKFGQDVIEALKSRAPGVSVGSIIVPLVEALSGTLAPALLEEGENVLYTIGNLAISEVFDEASVAVAANPAPDSQASTDETAAPATEEGQAAS